MKIIGYFQGTPPELLTKMNILGVESRPLGNMWDNYGLNVEIIRKEDVDIIVGWLHKVLPVKGADRTAKDLLWTAKTLEIPVILIVPTDLHNEAKKVLKEAADFVVLASPEDVDKKVTEVLGV